MKYSVLLLALLLSFSGLLFAADGEREWKKVRDKNGIQVYRAHTEESRLKSIRAVTRMELENIGSFVAVMKDMEGMPNWIHMLHSAELVNSDGPKHNRVFAITRLPWPVKDRLGTLDFFYSQTEDYTIQVDARLAETVTEYDRGYILVPEAFGFITIKSFPGTKVVELSWELMIDPGGYIPAFLVNLISDDVSYFTLKKLKRYIQSEKYRNYESDIVKRRPWVVQEVAANTIRN